MIVQIILVQNIFLDEFCPRVQDRRKRFEKGERERDLVESDLIRNVAYIARRSEGTHVGTVSAKDTHPVRTIDS